MIGRVVVKRLWLRKRWAFWRKPHSQLTVIGYHEWWPSLRHLDGDTTLIGGGLGKL